MLTAEKNLAEVLLEERAGEKAVKAKKDILVFVVDDNSVFLSSLAHYLKNTLPSFIHVKTFISAESCIKEINRQPDVVVLDYLLNSYSPRAMNGLLALKKIRHSLPGTAVIILSAQKKIDVAVNTLKAGAFEYITKNETAPARVAAMIRGISKSIIAEKETEDDMASARRLNIFVIAVFVAMYLLSRFTG